MTRYQRRVIEDLVQDIEEAALEHGYIESLDSQEELVQAKAALNDFLDIIIND